MWDADLLEDVAELPNELFLADPLIAARAAMTGAVAVDVAVRPGEGLAAGCWRARRTSFRKDGAEPLLDLWDRLSFTAYAVLVRDNAQIADIKRRSRSLQSDQNCAHPRCMPYPQFVKDVWVEIRQVGDDDVGTVQGGAREDRE